MAASANILVVDDDAIVRRSLARVLGEEGYRVDEAASGAEAVGLLEATRYELVILDLHMPLLGGLTVLQHARLRRPEIGIVVMTAFPTLENAKESIELGALEFLPKPLDAEEIRRVVSLALSRRSVNEAWRC
ncbi:MAG: hypothetical protein Fur0037_12320 [Planctomycetota bacterium]